jgi:hypothetical protein
MFVLGLAGLVIVELVLPTGSVPNPIALLGRSTERSRWLAWRPVGSARSPGRVEAA